MDFGSVSLCSPPKVHHHLLNLTVDGGRDYETRYGISGDGLDDCFDENFSSPLGEELVIPPVNFLRNPVS